MKKIALWALLGINLLVIMGFWWSNARIAFHTGPLMSLGMLAGLLAAYFVLLQFVLMGRPLWVERAIGLDKLSRLHHWNGYLALSFIILHPILITLAYASLAHHSLIAQFLEFLTDYEDVLNAFIAVILFVTIVGFSITIARKRLKYETWYAIHVFTYLAVILAWGHQLNNGGDFGNIWFVRYWYALYAFVGLNVIVFRFLRPLYLFCRYRFTVDRIVPETATVNSVYIRGNNLKRFHFKPGQFVKVTFLTKKFWYQSHPFSLSAMPGDMLRLTIRNVGDFTSQIPELISGTKVIVEGPFGIFTKKPVAKVALIAGGIGITPFRSLVEDYARSGADVVLLYSNRTNTDVPLKNELDAIAQQYQFPIHYLAANEVGVINQDMVKEYISDIAERHVYICGPPPMIKAVETMVRNLGTSPHHIYYELFRLGN